jgi:rhamnosyltransferase
LIEPITEEKAVVSYARQIPHPGANIISRFSRNFNFPEKGNIRGIEDAKKYGVYTVFNSDSCAAYLNSALDKIGGFRWTLSGEDTIAAAMLLREGYKISYTAEAEVEHSHNYTPAKEFVRHFDTGMYRKQWRKILDLGGGSDENRGTSYAKSLLVHVLKNEPLMLPTAFFQLAFGLLGYKFGELCYHRAPLWLYKKVSQADFFWNSTGFKEGKWFEAAK